MEKHVPLVTLRNDIKESLKRKDYDIAMKHMRQCAELNKKDDTYFEILEESLEWVCTDGFEEGAGYLLEMGVEPDKRDVYGNAALTLAAERGHAHIVKLLLQHNADVNRTDNETRSALHWSAMNGHFDVVKLLLENKAEPDTPDALYGFTPLMLAARQGHDLIVELLLSKGCVVDRQDRHKETALFYAVRNGQLQCVRHLLNAGAFVDHVDAHGRSLLFTAVLYNQVAVAAELLRANANVHIPGCVYAPLAGVTAHAQHTLKPKFSPLEAALVETKLIMAQLLYIGGAERCVLDRFAIEAERRVVASQLAATPAQDEPTDSPDARMLAWLREVCAHPRSLREACRITVRAAVASGWNSAYSQLPLPQAILHFLTIPELEPFSKVPKQNKRFIPH